MSEAAKSPLPVSSWVLDVLLASAFIVAECQMPSPATADPRTAPARSIPE